MPEQGNLRLQWKGLIVKKSALVIAASFALAGVPAASADYTTEIMDRVVKPCFLTLARQSPVEGFTAERLAMLATELRRDAVQMMIDDLNELFEDNPSAEAQEVVYELALHDCILGGS